MKNILVINSSHDGATSCFIDDLNKLDQSIPIQKNIFDIIKHDIEIHKLKEDYDSFMNHPSKKFGDFEWIYGEIVDCSGYGFINECHEVFGFKAYPYTVEHEIYVYVVSQI